MAYLDTVDVVSIVVAVILSAAILALLGLIIWKHRSIGQLTPLHDRDWFLDTFRQGAEIIRRCPWLLIIPLIGIILRFIEVLPSTHAALQKLPPPSPTPSFYWTSDGIFLLLRDVPREFIRAAGDLNTAAISAFQSGIVVLIILLGIAFLLLRSKAPSHRIPAAKPTVMRRRILGVLLLLASLCLYPLLFIWGEELPLAENLSLFVIYAVKATFLYIIAMAFGGGTLLLMMTAASDKQKLSLIKAFTNVQMYFRPLLLFGLLMAGVAHLAILPAMVSMFSDTLSGGSPRYLRLMTDGATNLIFALLAFVPVIIVKEHASLSSAFSKSITFWARNTKNAAAFVCISAFLLTVPMFLRGNLRLFFSHRGWSLQIALSIGALIIAAIGVLIMSSMVVFYKKMQEPEGEISQENSAIG
jgi:hypothetical protein